MAYTTTLDDTVVPFMREHYHNRMVFQQDGATWHTEKHMREHFMETGIAKMSGYHAPDMNCIENFWGILSRAVYEEGRHFETVEDLR